MLTRLGDFILDEPIYTGLYNVVFRGTYAKDKKPVAIKLLTNEHPTPDEIMRFKHEFEIAKIFETEKDIIHVFAFEKYETTYAIIMELIYGASLSDILKKEGKFNLNQFLGLAIQIVTALGHIHQKNIIHKDINPSNILYDQENNKIKIIDFGLSADLPKERVEILSPNVLEGSLGYISPEQTGRMNRGIDYRTDYYSLGVSFYQMLTGQLPFPSRDPMELVHNHIAGIPPSPHDVDPAIPEVISDIIKKLMAKKSEDRYQNTNGLLADLKKCQEQLNQTGVIQSFPLGNYDISSRFQIPEKLYGREKEVEILLKTYDDVARGNVRLMLVAGYSGIGKSALIHEIHKPISARHGYFIQGKFDQFKHNIPYAALTQAFEEFIKQLLTESADRITYFREKILHAVGDNGRIMIDVIPNLNLIIGEQPPVPELGAAESQNRFSYVFQNFITSLCGFDHPLVMFLDDLQWADLSSLKLLETLVTNADNRYIFMIGAYRSNEVSPAHPLMVSVSEVRKRNIVIDSIELGPLPPDCIAELLVDTLHQSPIEVQALAELCFEKTSGNPFFLIQLLTLLYKDKLIEFQTKKNKWTWYLSKIREREISDNVVQLMIDKLLELTPIVQRALEFAACIGNQFNLEILSTICNKEPEALLIDLQEALKEGYILSRGEAYRAVSYQFGHDRIQQAAHSLIPEVEKKLIHIELARLLLKRTPPEKLDEVIFDIVDHYNTGIETSIPDAIDAVEQKEIAMLNLRASRTAKSAAAFESAFRYIENALKCVKEKDWQNNYDLMLELYTLGAETAYLSTKYELAEEYANMGLQHSKNVFDQLAIIQTQVYSNVSQMKQRVAIDLVLKTLKQLGIRLPQKPNLAHVLLAVLKTKWLLFGKSMDDLLQLPEMTDQNKRNIVHLISTVFSSAYEANSNLFGLLVCTNVALSLRYGNTKGSAFSYCCYAILSCGVLQEIDKGYQLGELGLKLVEKMHDYDDRTNVKFVNHVFIRHWKEPLIDYMPAMVTNFDSGLDNGNFEIACLSITMYFFDCWLLGFPLKEMLGKIEKYKPIIIKTKQITVNNYLSTVQQSCLNMIKHNEAPGLFVGEAFDEIDMVPKLEAAHDKSGLFMLYSNKLILHYLFESYTDIKTVIKNCDLYAEAMVSSFQLATYFFYRSLTLLSLYTANQNTKEKKKMKKEVRASLKNYALWSKKAPANYSQRYYLIEAEYKWRVHGSMHEAIKLFDKAIAEAKKNEILNEEALANELAAKFFLEHDNKKIARIYMEEAYQCYRLWGADAKLAVLEEQYPNLLKYILSGKYGGLISGSISNSNTGTRFSETLDLSAFIKSSQIISNTIILEDLLKQLMRIVIENAGAQKSFLLLEKDDTYVIEAEGSIDQQEGKVLASIEMTADILPLSIINYVIRTKESVVLDYASRSQLYGHDPYIAKVQPASILCMPLLNQGVLTGILYLENNATAGAFTQDRIKILNLLSAQITISIQNARLFTDTKQLNMELIVLNKSYERFVPGDFFSLLKKKSIVDVKLGDQTQSIMTILFTDIRNFTDRSEKMTPQENFAFINSFLSVMAPIIRRRHGFIDKYIGDAIMALYPRSADDAIRCAFEMLEVLHDYNAQHPDQEPVKIGIGINTGLVMLGTVGAENRMNATVISDAVNVASRVESLTKTYNSSILITEDTYKQIKNPLVYQIEKIGEVPCKGKEKEITIYKIRKLNGS